MGDGKYSEYVKGSSWKVCGMEYCRQRASETMVESNWAREKVESTVCTVGENR